MNKKLLKSFAAAAMSVLAIACAKEPVGPGEGAMVEATFNVDVPEAIGTKAIGDGTTAKELWYQVFDKDGNVIAGLGKTKHESLLSDRQTSVSMQLVKDQTYNIVFWAQSEGQTCYKFDDLSQITVDYTAAKANEESRDAFLAVKNITVNGPINEKVEMKRPFAQLNIGTADAAIAAKAGVVIKTSKVEMKGLPNVLNTINGTTDGAVDVTFADNAVPSTEVLSVNGKEYTYLAMNYILAPAEGKEISDVKATFTAEGKDPVSLSAFSVPFQRNYRTNIIGNILTNSADFNVIVVPDFEGGDKVYDLDNINSAGALAALFANGGSGKLTEDVDVETFINVPSGKTVTLDMNGHKIENTVDLWDINNAVVTIDGGNLIIKGSGLIKAKENDCYVFNVKGAGSLIIESGEFVGNVSVIQVQEGSVEVRGGKFSLTQTWPEVGNGYDYTINLIDKAGKEGNATAKVSGGSFYKFDPSDNNSENPKKNYVAAGYKSTLVGDYYVVTKEDVTPVADQAGLDEAMANLTSEPATISLPAGNFTTYGKEVTKGKTLTFNGDGAENTNFVVGKNLGVSGEGNSDYSLENADVTFNDLTITTGDGLSYNYRGFVRAKSLTFVNCTIKERLSYWGGVVKFINCKFEPNTCKDDHGNILPDYNITTYQGTEFSFENCSFK
jgi:GLUG domain-containing protein